MQFIPIDNFQFPVFLGEPIMLKRGQKDYGVLLTPEDYESLRKNTAISEMKKARAQLFGDAQKAGLSESEVQKYLSDLS